MNSNFQKETVYNTILQYFQSAPPRACRILTDFERWSPAEACNTDAGKNVARIIFRDADALLNLPCCEWVMEGKRLLAVSRMVLCRINTLVMAWKMTGEEKYARRGIQEILHAASYHTWNPDHFLDVGEMALALAIGTAAWDALMTEAEHKTVARALWDKAVLPSLPENVKPEMIPSDETKAYLWWIDAVNNWAPVCHAGVIAAALIAGEEDPETAAGVIVRAVENLPVSMKASYYPNGAYPEGPIYWAYGTDFTCLCLGLLQNAFGTDFGLSEMPGWSTTGKYLAAVLAPSGLPYNYADGRENIAVGYAWFYLESQYPGSIPLPPFFVKKLQNKAENGGVLDDLEHGRLLPLVLLHLTASSGKTAEFPLAYYSGDASTMPLATFRSGREDDCVYFGIKGGGPKSPHGHMDAGSFILETDQVRWAVDLGMEMYHLIEARGFSLWVHSQESDRWRVFRLNSDSHNILRINNAPQLVDGWGTVKDVTDQSVRLDLSSLYNDVKMYERSASVHADGVEICDRWQGLSAGSVIRFQFCTRAVVELCGDTVILRQDGKALRVFAAGMQWKSAPASEWMQEWDSDNNGAQMVWCEASAAGDGALTVVFERSKA